MTRVGCLVHTPDRIPLAPETQPLGRAALALRDEGIEVVFGSDANHGRLGGAVAVAGGWKAVDAASVCAVFDRFPRRDRPEEHRRAMARLEGVPVCNGVCISDLCTDKVAAQRWLESQGLWLPPIEADASRFGEALGQFGTAFLKPRYGLCGRGVRRVETGDPTPAEVEVEAGTIEPALLQEAVPPPDGWAGVSVRVLVQRIPDGWVACPGVARRSREDPVVAACRGAEVTPLSDLGPAVEEDCVRQSLEAARALARADGGNRLVEVGVDLVVSPSGPKLIEVNSRPWGRLAAIVPADPLRFDPEHQAACMRPFRTLAASFG